MPLLPRELTVIIAGLLLTCPVAIRAAAPPKPDVLVILTDQWSPRYVSWDHPQVRTPNLDRLAAEGLIFDACYTPSPLCVPARISLLTGLYPHNHGHAVWGNPNRYHLPAGAAPMFRDIQRAGYTTAQFGKLHWFCGPGWKSAFATLEEYHRAMGLDAVVNVPGPVDSAAGNDPYSAHLRQLGVLDAVAADLRQRYLSWEYEPRASLLKPADYHDSVVTGLAVDFILRQPKERPMCLVVSLHSPHPPLDAPGDFAKMFDPERLTLPANVPERFSREKRTLDRTEMRRLLANYLGKIALVDHCTGRLIEAMQSRGTWSDALVIFTADHGEMMGAHGLLSKGRFWEESARVPLVVRWPGRVVTGRTQALAQMMDVYPTIVEAIGGQIAPGHFAKSLMPVAEGKKSSVRELAVSEIGKTPPYGIMARDARFKYWADEEGEHLFDIENDALETRDLSEAPEHQDALNRMRERLLWHLRTTQVNLAGGSKPKVQRMREAAAKPDP